MEAVTLKKYPRTPHLEGSRLQPGDEDLSQVVKSTHTSGHFSKISSSSSGVSPQKKHRVR